MNSDQLARINRLTQTIIGCAFKVGNTLGSGFLEKVYERALAHELTKAGLRVQCQRPISVMYDGVRVGEFAADLLVEDQILVETKAVRAIDDVHRAQCINYLAATGLPVCLLLNFGAKVDVRRIAGRGLTLPALADLSPSVSSSAPLTWGERAELNEY